MTWLQDLVEVASKQGIDGQALQSLHRAAGGNGGDALHALIRDEFGTAARLGHRLRLLEGLSELFNSPPHQLKHQNPDVGPPIENTSVK